MIKIELDYEDDLGYRKYDDLVFLPGVPRVGDHVDVEGLARARKVEKVVWCTYRASVCVMLEDGN